MTSRATSTSNRLPSSSSSHQLHHPTTTSNPHAQPHRRQLLTQPPSRRALGARRVEEGGATADPSSRPRSAVAPPISAHDSEIDYDSDSDILVREPIVDAYEVPPSGFRHSNGRSARPAHAQAQSTDLNAQALAEALKFHAPSATTGEGVDPANEAHLLLAQTGGEAPVAESAVQDEAAQLIEMYRRRERERTREGVDGQDTEEALKAALWERLRSWVKGLDADRWMFEVEPESEGRDVG